MLLGCDVNLVKAAASRSGLGGGGVCGLWRFQGGEKGAFFGWAVKLMYASGRRSVG